MERYADVVLPLAQPAYTFAVPEGMELAAGCAVEVQFGPRKFHTGIVWRVHERRPDFKRIKPVQRPLYDRPLLTAAQMKLWEWVASYYMCSLGEVMRAALPSLMKPSADSRERFADEEFRPRTECYLSLAPELRDEERLHEVFEKLERRAPKQYEALLELVSAGDGGGLPEGEVPRRLLQSDRAVLHALERKGFVRAAEHERTAERGEAVFRLPQLTPHQQAALDELRRQFADGKATALLHGVTSSGKTEIYIHLIAEVLARGGDVLLLVPEIALTAQLIERMERIFGSRVTPYHSRLTDRQRSETYLRLNRSEGGEFVVGVRSSIFLPLARLQLIIVDEEHDASYKQAEPAPRYHARDCAVMMARIFGGRTLLGSATPSLETWLHASGGKYGRATLSERYGDARMPEIIVSDTLRAARRGERHAHFNKLLLDKIGETLGRGEQVMLFQNRRGFSPYVECTECGWTARCPDCNVTLTYHKAGGRLVCHYCGHSEPVPAKCPSCKVTDVVPMGFGTEKIEEEIARIFPEARVARLDRDTVTSERAFSAIVAAFARRETDILVGTQMITKGFDFEGVALVGILNADNMLNNPDFRAGERAFQLMMQVAGRAGRRAQGGEVVIQTAEPGHPVVRQVVEGDFGAMARMQLADREAFFYPPYARLTTLTLRHRDLQLLRRGAVHLAAGLRRRFGRRLLGPMAPPVDRIRGEYLLGLLLKIESGASSARARELLGAELQAFAQHPEFRHIAVIPNVDPQ
ncbi:primosomal protein N' [uncultured Alistipes sp.]|uniref:replication restart helicase PriA n=1 Tax=uncultured Alistipes sp. TaxID=538949 RepID=UPI002592E780|nr:primosomal protein N' [uncultured Alistipes sp.]